jgi:hypothetical protein
MVHLLVAGVILKPLKFVEEVLSRIQVLDSFCFA